MTPADIDRHTAEVRELLKGTGHKPVALRPGRTNPYEASKIEGVKQTGGMTFAWAFGWSKEAEAQRPAWEHLIRGFQVCLGEVYPECQVANSIFKIEKSADVALMIAQYYAQMRRSLRGNLVYIEVDVVCNKRCDPFEADFDIGIPDAPDSWAMMPFNPGVVFSRDTPGAQKFFDTAMEFACDIPGNFPQWYVYQLALAHTWHVLKDVVNIKIFPNEVYNYSPDVYAPSDAYFIHLKGPRKAMQRDYVVPIIEGRRGRFMLPQGA